MTTIAAPVDPDIVVTSLQDLLVIAAFRPGRIFSVNAEIGPEFAQDLLKTNIGNRKVIHTYVDSLAKEMEAGRWKDNGQPIIVTDARRMTDGQNRLLAVIQSGVVIRAQIMFGISDDYQVRATLDQGKGRTVANILQIAGVDVHPVAERIGSLLAALDPSQPIRMARTSKADYTLAHFNEIEPWTCWAEAVSAASPVVEGTRRRRNRSIGAATVGVLGIHIARCGADTAAFREFMDGTAQNLDLEVLRTLTHNRVNILNLANRRLRNGYMLGRPNGGSMLYPTLTEMALYVRTFNHYLLDDKVEQLKGNYSEDLRWLDDLPKPLTGGKR